MDLLYILELMGNFLLGTSLVFSWIKLYNKEIKISKLKNAKTIMSIIIIMIGFTIATTNLDQPCRIIIINVLLLSTNFILINNNMKKAVTSTIISQIVVNILEFSFIMISSAMYGNKIYTFLSEPIGNFTINVYVSFLVFLIFKSKIIKLISKFLKNMKDNSIVINSIVIVIIMILTTIESYMKLPIQLLLLTNTLISVFFILLIYKFTEAKNKYNNINNKYQTSITSLKEYETMIDKFRVNTHENKNELLTIRNMIKSNDKKTVEYIDKLVDNKIKDNEKIMYQTSKIPEGGLRATIYSKLCVMDKYKIKYKLDISKDVRTVDLINLDEELILNICKILGVFMDNAIESVIKLRKKEIDIELYVIDDELYIDITNNFKGEMDLSKIGHERHTTKGEEHGYGLLLVNKIINDNKRYLENEKSINSNYFTQTLKISLK